MLEVGGNIENQHTNAVLHILQDGECAEKIANHLHDDYYLAQDQLPPAVDFESVV